MPRLYCAEYSVYSGRRMIQDKAAERTDFVERWSRWISSERSAALPIMSLAGVVIGLGVYLRIQNLGFPPVFSWDEHHFVENARNYVNGAADWNDHPPLGKLLIAAFIRLLGDEPAVWRLAPLSCGLVTILLAGRLAKVVFQDEGASWLAAAFVAGDGFLISYSRAALLDGMLTMFVLLATYWMLKSRSIFGVLKTSIAVGCAASIKTSGAALVLPVALWCVFSGFVPRVSVLLLAMAPVTYAAQFAYGLMLSHRPSGLVDVIRVSRELLVHHLGLTDMTHPATSRWYTWILPKRPIVLRFDLDEAGRIRSMNTLGNPLLWWSSVAAVLHLAVVHGARQLARFKAAVVRLRNAKSREGRTVESAQLEAKRIPIVGSLSGGVWGRTGWVTLVWLTMLLPWIVSARDSYIYHYLPSYTLGLVLLAGVIAEFQRSRPLQGLVVVLVIAEVTVWYAPVWAQLPLTETGYNARLFLKAWR